METDFQALLLGSAGVTALVGQEVHWDLRPEGAPHKHIILTLPSDVPDYASTGATGLTHARVRVRCWAHSKAEAKAIATAVDTLLSGYRGGSFQGIFRDVETSGAERGDGAPNASDPSDFFNATLDYECWHAATS